MKGTLRGLQGVFKGDSEGVLKGYLEGNLEVDLEVDLEGDFRGDFKQDLEGDLLKFNSFELDSEVGRLVILAVETRRGMKSLVRAIRKALA